MGPMQSPVQTSPLAEIRANDYFGAWWSLGGAPQIVIVEIILTPLAVPTNGNAGRLASPGAVNGVDTLPAERTPASIFSMGANPSLGSGAAMATPVFDVPVPATGASPVFSPIVAAGPSFTATAGVDAGIQYTTNSVPTRAMSSFLGGSLVSEPVGQGGIQGQGWLVPPRPTPGMAIPPAPVAELRSPDQHALPSLLLPPQELDPQDLQEELLPYPHLSSLGAGLRQFLAAFNPLGQQVAALSPPDLPSLQAGLLQFMEALGDTGTQLVVSQDGAATRIWILAAAGAGAACAIAYRQQRRSALVCAMDVPPLPGCSLDDAL